MSSYQQTIDLLTGAVAILALTTIISLVSAARMRSLYRRMERMRGSVAPKRGTTRNVCLVVGLGGSGKTSLIRALTGDPRARPDIKTGDFSVYRSEIAKQVRTFWGTKKIDRCTLFIADYDGQRFDQLVGSIFRQQNHPEFPVKYDCIDCLVFLVDLFPPPPLSTNPVVDISNRAIDSRFEENIQFWVAGGGTLDAIFGMTASSLKYVCLFLNKFDLVPDKSPARIAEITNKYVDLQTKLNLYNKGKKVTTIMGSAETGFGIDELRLQMIDAVTRPMHGGVN